MLPDHVHLLVSVDPQFGIHRLIKLVKGRSSRFLRQEFPVLKHTLPTLWTKSYFVATTGGASLSGMKQYIEQQKHVSADQKQAKERSEAEKDISFSHLSNSQTREKA